MSSLWIDLSTARKWQGPPVGIVRTEFMVARELLAAGVPGLHYCYFDRERSEYLEIPRPAAEEMLQRLETTAAPDDSVRKPRLSALHACTSQLKRATLRGIGLLPRRLHQHLRAWIGAWLQLARASVALLRSIPPVRRSRNEADRPVSFSHGDGYLSMGLDWDSNDLKVLGAVRNRYGLKVFLMCYDLIPIYQPHLAMPLYSQKFREYFRDLLACADMVFVISGESQKQLLRYAREIESPIPSTQMVRLGVKIHPHLRKSIPQLVSRPFILMVSTIEVRKNHRLLYQIWTRMRADPDFSDPPHLVMVGRRGWRVDDLLDEMGTNPDARDFVHHFENISDEELEWLYGNCLFTVFPSLYEGFGLPVLESLAHGKCCVSSNTSSLPEVGQNLTQLLDPLDFAAWYTAIKALVFDEAMRRDNEARIRACFTTSSWKETSEAMYRTIRAMTTEQPTSFRA
jgi:glycosyltransferase involved in cell wall biosynthesis